MVWDVLQFCCVMWVWWTCDGRFGVCQDGSIGTGGSGVTGTRIDSGAMLCISLQQEEQGGSSTAIISH